MSVGLVKVMAIAIVFLAEWRSKQKKGHTSLLCAAACAAACATPKRYELRLLILA